MDIFEFSDYRAYLVSRVGGQGSRTGVRQQMAKFLRVHSTFVSHVLGGKADFSAEQIEDLNEFLGHTAAEADFMHILVAYERAGSQKLKQRLLKQLKSFVESQNALSKQIKGEDISDDLSRTYYSKIVYPLVHMAAPLQKYQNQPVELALATQSTPGQIREALEFLVKTGLLTKHQEGERTLYRLGKQHVHIPRGASWFKDNHINYRLFALHQFSRSEDSDLHFSSAFTATLDDFEKIKEIQKKALKKQSEIISASKEEDLFIFNFDLLKVRP